MKRREFIALLGGATAAWPLAAGAQQAPKIARIGFLGVTTQSGVERRLQRFRTGLRDRGYVEGENILIDFRWAEGNFARLAEFAAELIRLKVDILVTHTTPGTLAAKGATTTVPIVMIVNGDAVATGIVASLAPPGGNVTGSTFFDPELQAKRLEVFKEAYPSAKRIAVLLNPDNPENAPVIRAMELTAASLKLELQQFQVRSPEEFESAVSSMNKTDVDGVAVTSDIIFVSNVGRVAEITAANRLPSIGDTELARAGGLLGYGVNFLELYYRAAYFVDRILKEPSPQTCRSSNRLSSS